MNMEHPNKGYGDIQQHHGENFGYNQGRVRLQPSCYPGPVGTGSGPGPGPDVVQPEFQNFNHSFHTHPQRTRSPYRIHRGNPRMAPWMRQSRFGNPNQSQPLYSDNYGSPRTFHPNRGGNTRYGLRENSVHRMVQPYGSGYRNGRRYGRPSHVHSYQQPPSSPYYGNNHPNNPVQEYVPYPFSPISTSEFQHLTHHGSSINGSSSDQSTVQSISHGVYNNNAVSPAAEDVDGAADGAVIPYCPNNFRMVLAADSASSLTEISSNKDKDQERPSSVASSSSSTDKTISRRASTDSSDGSGSVSSVSLSSETDSSSDIFSVEDSGVSTCEPSEEEKSGGNICTGGLNNAFNSVDMEEYLGSEETIDFKECEDGAPAYITDEQDYITAYVEAKSCNVIDSKGYTSMGEISCYGVWFGRNNKRNALEEVPSTYNMERRKSGYILGVIKALSTVKNEGDCNRLHLVMGSPFVMENLNGWVKNLKHSNATSTNWTEWKHFNEILELLAAIDGMVLKFSLAHPRDNGYKECKLCVSRFHEEMKQTRLQQSGNVA